MSRIRFLFSLKGLLILALPFFLSACGHAPSMHAKKGKSLPSAACVGNAYMQKYGCSLERIQQAARNGDPDAQYALGYMYYYGIGTVRDSQTARLWIKRSAAQGQPLAKKAESLLAQGVHLDSLHGRPADAGRTNRSAPTYDPTPSIRALNARVPGKPISNHLPSYGKARDEGAKQKSVIHSLQLKGNSDSKPASTVGPGKDENMKEPSVEPLTQAPSRRRAINDARLALGASTESMETANYTGRQAITATEHALLRIPAKQYTLQLLSSHNLAAVKTFIRQHHLAGLVQVYSATVHNKSWYTLIYGKYPSVMRARDASQQLPSSLRAMHPWVKSFRVIHRQIRQRRIVS